MLVTRGAYGIDGGCRRSGWSSCGVWRRRDQTGNTRTAAERSATLEGVADRLEFVEAAAPDLSFPAESFDVVASDPAISATTPP